MMYGIRSQMIYAVGRGIGIIEMIVHKLIIFETGWVVYVNLSFFSLPLFMFGSLSNYLNCHLVHLENTASTLEIPQMFTPKKTTLGFL